MGERSNVDDRTEKIRKVRSTCVASLPHGGFIDLFESNGIARRPRDALIRAVRPDTTKIIPRGEYHRGDLGTRLSLLSWHDASRPSGVLLFIVPALPRLASGTHLLRPEVRNFFALRVPLLPARARDTGLPAGEGLSKVFEGRMHFSRNTYLALSALRGVSPPVNTQPPRDHVRPLSRSALTVFGLPLNTDVRCRSASLVKANYLYLVPRTAIEAERCRS